MAFADFVHLRTHSAFSLAEGAIKVKDLIDLCHRKRMPAVALTDSANLFGAMEFSLAAAQKGIQPIIGCTLWVAYEEDDPRQKEGPLVAKNDFDTLILLAKSQLGYQNLMKLISKAYIKYHANPLPYVAFQDLKEHSQDLIVLSGGLQGGIGKLLLKKQAEAAEHYLQKLSSLYPGNLYIELSRRGLREEQEIEDSLINFAYKYNLPLVATNDVYFDHPQMFEAHDVLLCIAEGSYVNQSDRRRVSPESYFKSAKEMRELFRDLPEAVDNTLVIAKRCGFVLEPSKPMLPAFSTEKGEECELKDQAREGLEMRLKNQVFQEDQRDEDKEKIRKDYCARLDFELETIIRMGYAGYYLIVADFIKWAKTNGIPVGPGRGSGAGSLVAWSLTITDIDPIRFGLIFERFLNPERVSMPDFDIDFCQERRDEVIAYVAERYGVDKVAQIITFGKLQARAVLRDVGRVLGMPYGQVDKICKLVPNNPANPVTLEQAFAQDEQLKAMAKEDPQVEKLLDIGMKLEGLYRHASTHAAGVVIGDRSLDEVVAIYSDGKSTMPATQFNMKDVEAAGLVKFDFLGLKTLTIIQRTIDLLKKRDIDIEITKIPLDDEKTFKLLQSVETVGIFQVEGSGMRDVLRKLHPNRFEELIALVALYRPGPMDDIPRYLSCKHGQEVVHYHHPLLEDILKETFGVMVYQEQVMKIAQVLGGYSLGAADLLRRAMGKKIKKEMDAQRQIFVDGALKNSIDSGVASQIFDQMAKFAGYGFNKSHSAPYALITYQTAYFKANYPVEYLAASMTFDLNNTDKLNIYKQELKRLGIPLLLPDINASYVDFHVECDEHNQQGVRYALAAIKNVGGASIQSLVEEREKHGPFQDIFDFARRLDSKVVNKRQLENLIQAGAFDKLNPNRAQLFASIDFILSHVGVGKSARESNQNSLFGESHEKEIQAAIKLPMVENWAPLEKAQREFDAVGFYLSSHPLDGYLEKLERLKVVKASHLRDILAQHHTSIHLAGIVISKKERLTKQGQRYAFVQFSDLSGSFEVTLFSELYTKYREKIEPGNALFLKVLGRLEEDNIRLNVQEIWDLEPRLRDIPSFVKIDMTAQEGSLLKLKEVLATAEKGENLVELIVTSSTTTFKITLPGSYNIDESTQGKLRQVPGVKEIIYA